MQPVWLNHELFVDLNNIMEAYKPQKLGQAKSKKLNNRGGRVKKFRVSQKLG